jgi:hypothetical protein
MCRDLSYVNLSGGDASFLWELTQLTCLRIGNSQVRRCAAALVLLCMGVPFPFVVPGILSSQLLTSTSNAGVQMPASQFAGISRLVHLVEVDASATQFDDAGCLALASATGLRNIKYVCGALSCCSLFRACQPMVEDALSGQVLNDCPLAFPPACSLAHSLVTGAGIAMLNASHAGTLQQLRLEGCHVSMWAVSQLLRCQSRHLCLWDTKRRGHLPRVFNVLNQLLVCPLADGGRALRLCHAPEATWLQQGLMLGLVAGILLGQALLLVLTTVILLLSPAIMLVCAFCLLLLHAAGATADRGGISVVSTYIMGRAEVWLSAVLVGIHCVHVPPPPPPTTLYS